MATHERLDCLKCPALCCRMAGYVRVSRDDIRRLAKHLTISVAEFEKRLCGVSYEEIARAGGGIQSTVQATREATHEQLHASAAVRAGRLMAEGVTTIEVKSGYGLALDAERRLLEVARDLERKLPVSIKKTFLGLHALPPEFAASSTPAVTALPALSTTNESPFGHRPLRQS